MFLVYLTEFGGCRMVFSRCGTSPTQAEHGSLACAQGPTEQAVKAGKAEVKRILEETTERVMRRDQGAGGAVGRYTVM